MKYIDSAILEIFIYLLFNQKPLKLDNKRFEAIRFLENLNIIFGDKATEIIDCSIIDETSQLIEVKKKKNFEDALQKYLINYKLGKLQTPERIVGVHFAGYFPYVDNLLYIKELINNEPVTQNALTLDSYRIRNSNEGGAKVRFLEFVLDLYFEKLQKKEFIDIKSCLLQPIGFMDNTLKVKIQLVKNIDDIIKELKIAYLIYTKDSSVTERQKEVIELAFQGYQNRQIATKLVL